MGEQKRLESLDGKNQETNIWKLKIKAKKANGILITFQL